MASTIPDEFVPLHVHYRRDRAIRAAGANAELLYLRALAFARANRTGGVIEDFDLDELGTGIPDATDSAATLVRVGLWVTSGAGWLIRSWEKWNPANASESGTFGNHKRWHLDRGLVAPNCPHCLQEQPESSPPNRPDDSPRIAPMIAPISGGIAEESRREENREEEKREEERVASQAKRARALPPGWQPDEAVATAIRAELPALDLAAEHRKFCDHFTANGKPMKDWNAAWRNWMRRATQFAPTTRRTRQQETDDLFAAAARRMGVTPQPLHNHLTIEGTVA